MIPILTRTWEDLEAALQHRRHHPHPNPPPTPISTSCPQVSVCVVNRSTVVSVTELAAAMVDLQTQVSHDFAPIWLIEADLVTGAPAAGDYILSIEDDSTVQGALGYHEEAGGVPTGHVFAKTSQENGVHWTSVASHELLEMLGDPRTVLAAVVDPNGDGRSGRIVMAEACDAVEQSSYTVGQTEVSNFVYPAWWDTTATGPFDHLGQLKAPLELLPGGSYIGYIDFTSSAGWQQQTAEKAPSK